MKKLSVLCVFEEDLNTHLTSVASIAQLSN
jgi:hypothetical protein